MTKSIFMCLQDVKEEGIRFEKGLVNKDQYESKIRATVYDAKEAENSLQVFRNELSKLFCASDKINQVLAYALAVVNACK